MSMCHWLLLGKEGLFPSSSVEDHRATGGHTVPSSRLRRDHRESHVWPLHALGPPEPMGEEDSCADA